MSNLSQILDRVYASRMLPYKHELQHFIDDPFAAQKYARLFVTEHAPRYWQATISFSYYEYMRLGENVAEIIALRFETAVMSLRDVIERDYAYEVLPWDTPSGE